MEVSQVNKALKEIKNKEKSFKIISNKNHLFEVILINEDPYLLIKTSYNNSIRIINYEERHSLETIIKNPFFNNYESIDKILEELFSLINSNKNICLLEENKQIILIFKPQAENIKEIKFTVKEKEKSDKDKIDELYNIVLELKKENNILKLENSNLKKRIDNNENCINELIKRMEINENRIISFEKEKKEKVVERKKELKGEKEEMEAFLAQNIEYKSLFEMLRIGITVYQVEEKARLNGFDMNLFNEMVEKAKKAYPNIH